MLKEQRSENQQEVLLQPAQALQSNAAAEEQQLPYPGLAPVVFGTFSQTTRVRFWCLQMIHSPWLDYLSIVVALITCMILCMYTPQKQSNYMEVLDALIVAFFMLEMLMKMLALGFVEYIQNNWNTFDILINIGEVLDHVLACFGIQWHAFQAFRPMRLCGRIPSMRVLVAALADIVPMLCSVLLLNMLVIHIFSIVGVQLWAGQLRNRCFLGEDISTKYNVSLSPSFHYISTYGEKVPYICSPDDKHGMRRCRDLPPSRVDGETCSLAAPNHSSAADLSEPTMVGNNTSSCVNWNIYYNICRAGDENPCMGVVNFDNIGFSLIAMFQVVTLEGWTEIMFYVMDAHSYWNCLFLVFVTIVGSLVMMNVCAVVIATKFTENMERNGERHAGTVTVAQVFAKVTCWLQGIFSSYQRRGSRVQPDCSDGMSTVLGQAWTSTQRILKRTVESAVFDRLIMVTVFLSILALVVEHHEQPKMLTQALALINVIITTLFLVEMILKVLVFKWEYFQVRDNVIDFVIVFISLWVIFNTESKLSVLRSLRLLRFVKLLRFLPYLRRQLLVLQKTIGRAATLWLLLLFVSFLFSILGMLLFGGKFTFRTEHGDLMTDRKNFDSLHWSMITVFQILTQEDWNVVLYNAISATSPWAMLYFVGLILVGKKILLNVLVGIVVQSFQCIENPTDLPPEDDPHIESSENVPSRPSSKSGPSASTVVHDVPAPQSTDEDNESRIQRVLRWFKEREDWSLYMLSPRNRFRVFCRRVISHSMFDHVVLLFILLSCVTIALERPAIDPNSTERMFLKTSRYLFLAIFLGEMLFKVLALGLLFGKESYSRSLWNVVDGLLVIFSLVHIFVSMIYTGNPNMLSTLKVLRLLRTLRPLRVIKRAPKLKLAVEALIRSAKPIGSIVLICCALFSFFGVLGVQLFRGKFFRCLGYDTRNITTKAECLSADYRWTRKTFTFDSFPQALMTLFVMYSKDGWVNIMYDGLDAVGVDKQPVENNNEWMLLYFISFMIMSVFLLDMFIGVMVYTFHQCQQEQRQADALSQEGGGEAQNQRTECEQRPYYEDYSRLRRWIHTLCTSSFLHLFMTVIIFLSVMVMSIEHYNQPQYITDIIEYSCYVFTAIFILEVLIKLVAFGVKRFIKDRWNLLDVAIVFVSIVSIITHEIDMAHTIPINPSFLRICRILRLTQVLKAKKIRVLLYTIIKTLSQVENICLLFMFFFFIYAALGVELFGRLKCTEDYPCQGLNQYISFRNFGAALLTLYKVCTGDSWSGILKDTLRECPPGAADCPAYLSWISPLYFMSFVIMAQFVLINLVVAAIMQALDDSSQEVYNQRAELDTATRETVQPGLDTSVQRSPAETC